MITPRTVGCLEAVVRRFRTGTLVVIAVSTDAFISLRARVAMFLARREANMLRGNRVVRAFVLEAIA